MTSTPITTADIAKGKIDDALSVREKIATAWRRRRHRNNLPDHELSHLFLHRRFWLNSGAGRTLFIALRVFDAISDPVMGVIADRTQSRWGRFVRGSYGLPFPSALSASRRSSPRGCQHGVKIAWAFGTTCSFFSRLYRHQRRTAR